LPFDALSPSCREFLFTSESGNEGHPDNSWGVCDARRGGSSNMLMDRIAFKILVVRVLYVYSHYYNVLQYPLGLLGEYPVCDWTKKNRV